MDGYVAHGNRRMTRGSVLRVERPLARARVDQAILPRCAAR